MAQYLRPNSWLFCPTVQRDLPPNLSEPSFVSGIFADGIFETLEHVLGRTAKDDDGIDVRQNGGKMAAREVAGRMQGVGAKRAAVEDRQLGVGRSQHYVTHEVACQEGTAGGKELRVWHGRA